MNREERRWLKILRDMGAVEDVPDEKNIARTNSVSITEVNYVSVISEKHSLSFTRRFYEACWTMQKALEMKWGNGLSDILKVAKEYDLISPVQTDMADELEKRLKESPEDVPADLSKLIGHLRTETYNSLCEYI